MTHSTRDVVNVDAVADAVWTSAATEATELRRVEVRPGDLFVLRVPRRISQAEAAAFHDQWRSRVGPHVPLVIVECGELTVFRAVDPEAVSSGE